jgi:hypothetical protein
MTFKLRLLRDLTPGDRFLIPGLGKKGTLAYCSPSSATVDYDSQPKTVTFTTKWGEKVTMTKASGERVSISLGTEVVKLVRKLKGGGE